MIFSADADIGEEVGYFLVTFCVSFMIASFEDRCRTNVSL